MPICFVILPHFLEETGGFKSGVVGHRCGELPEEGRRRRVSLAVNGVVVFHMLRRHVASIRLPHSQCAQAHELVRIGVEFLPHGGIGDVLPEGGHPIAVLFVHRRGGHCPLHRPHSFSYFYLARNVFHYIAMALPGQVSHQ